MFSNKYASQKWDYIIISLIAIVFGYWFARQQLYALSPEAFNSYPKFYFLTTICKCFFTILISFSLSYLLLAHFSRQKLGSKWVANSFLPLLLVYLHCPLIIIFFSILAIQLFGLIYVWRADDYLWLLNKYSVDVMALFLIFILHLIISSEFSPLHWKHALFTLPMEEISIEAPLYKGYSLAKQFVFSTMDYSEWAGVLNPPITLASPFLQFLTLVLDLPSLNPFPFHVLVLAINFLLIVGGSFGCYLFLKYAGKIRTAFAILGCCLMFFSASPYLQLMISNDGAVFLSSYATLPYCLLFLSLACEKKSLLLAGWTGVAMTAQFFILTPHPEGIIYLVLFMGCYAVGLILFSSYLNFLNRTLLIILAFISFFLLSAYVVVPILVDQFAGNMYTFAHMDIAANQPLNESYVHIFKIFIPLSLVFVLGRRRSYPVYLPSLFLCLCFYVMQIATTNIELVKALVNNLHVGLHVWTPWRMQMYVCFSLFIVTVICLDAITCALMQFIRLDFFIRFLRIIRSMLFILLLAKDKKDGTI